MKATVEKRRDIVGLKLLVVAEARILEGVEAGVGEDSRLVDSDGRAHHTRRRAGRVEAKLLHAESVASGSGHIAAYSQ